MWWQTVQPVLVGLGTGVVSGLVGYAKSIPKGESFNFRKAGPIIIFAGFVGVYAAFKGISITNAQGVLAAAGVGLLVNYLWGTVWKFINNKRENGSFISK